MAGLIDKNINATYEGLLKTFDNNSLITSNRITDGIGTSTALTLGSINNGSSFDGSLVAGTTLLVCNDLTTNNNLCVKGSTTIDNNLIVKGDTTSTGITGQNFKLGTSKSTNYQYHGHT